MIVRNTRLGIVLLSFVALAPFLSSCAKERKAYDKVGKLVQTRDGTSQAFQAIRGDKQFIVFNGHELKAYEGVLPPLISPDGKRVAYGALREGKWFYVVDGKEGKPYDRVEYAYFGKDGQNFAYEVKQGNQWMIVINEKEGPLYDKAGVYDFTPDDQLYTAERQGKTFVVWKGVEGKSYDNITDLKPSPRGRKLSYMAHEDKKDLLVVNGNEHPQDYDVLGSFEWSSDESQLAFDGIRYLSEGGSVIEKKEHVIVDGDNGEKIK